ncbi:MAG TPA: response regulator [Polyangiaceae bacterium]
MPNDSPARGGAQRSPYAKFAHEINNPLAIVLSNLEFAIAELSTQADGGGELVEALGEARQAVERIRDLVIGYAGEFGDAPTKTFEPAPMPRSTPKVGTRARVLVVDDEPVLGRAISRGLREHDVVVVTTGNDALALFESGERFDVVLCDLMMPSMPGFDLHDQLRLLAPDQADRMVFMTGGATTTRAREFVASRSDVVLQKPVSMDTVRETVARLLRSTKTGGP